MRKAFYVDQFTVDQIMRQRKAFLFPQEKYSMEFSTRLQKWAAVPLKGESPGFHRHAAARG